MNSNRWNEALELLEEEVSEQEASGRGNVEAFLRREVESLRAAGRRFGHVERKRGEGKEFIPVHKR